MNIKKILSDVPQGKEFFMHDGTALRNLEELREEIKFMSEEDFRRYVNDEKNDFANWIEYVIGDKELADRLRLTKDRENAFKLINSRIIFLKIKLENQEENEINYVEREIERLKDNINREEKIIKEINQEEKKEKEEKTNEEKLIEEIERKLKELEKDVELNKKVEEPPEEKKKEEVINEIIQLNKEEPKPITPPPKPKEPKKNKHKETAEKIIWALIGFVIGMIIARII